MLPTLFAFAVALAVVRLLFSELARNIALDQPNERSLHQRPTPRTGGLGIVAGVAAGWLAAGGAPSEIALSAMILVLISLADDVLGLGSGLRFGAQIIAAGLFIAGSGLSGGLMALAVLVGIVWCANLYNFMDGSDGMAGGMAVIGFGAYALIAVAAGDSGLAITAGVIAAAAAGFLVWNFHPARIFMGDAGSVPLGFLAAAIGLLGWQRGIWPTWVPCLVFSPFAIDATVTLLRRMARGERFWEAHRTHYYQRTIQLGLGHRLAALVAYAIMLAAAITAFGFRNASPIIVTVVLAAWAAAYAFLARRIDGAWARRPSRAGPSGA